MKNKDATKLSRKPDPTLPRRWTPQVWADADSRFAMIKTMRERCETLKADCNADSFQKEILCQRAVFIGLWLETQERQAIETGDFNASEFIQAVNGLLGLLKALGLNKASKAIPNLADYLDGKGKVKA